MTQVLLYCSHTHRAVLGICMWVKPGITDLWVLKWTGSQTASAYYLLPSSDTAGLPMEL